MAVIGVDVGTTGCKATIISDSGRICVSKYAEYSPLSLPPGYQEIDPAHVWASVLRITGKCVREYDAREKIVALSVSSLGEAVVPLNDRGEVLGPGMLYTDIRGAEEVLELEKAMDRSKFLMISGVYPQKMYSLAKIMWLHKHCPEIYSRAKVFLPFDGFILFRFGAPAHTNYSLAARTMAFNVTEKKWSREILDAAGVSIYKMPEAVVSGTIVGTMKSDIASSLGIPNEVLLVAGGHDQPCASLGSGVYVSKTASDGLGSVESINPAFEKPVLNEKMAEFGFACVPHVIQDMYITYAFSYTAGRLLKWYRDVFARHDVVRAKKKGCDIYDLLIDEMSDRVSSLYVLPYLAGAATPYMDNEVQGAFIGLTLDTGLPDLVRACLEGITFESMVNIEHLKEAGVEVNQLMASGGMTRSEKFMQMKADMMGIELTTLQCSEAGTLGVGILASVAAGVYANIEEAVGNIVKIGRTFHPDEHNHQYYRERFAVYKSIYPAVRQIGKVRE